MTSKVEVQELQNGRFFNIQLDGRNHLLAITRLEATELRDALTRALRKTRNPQ